MENISTSKQQDEFLYLLKDDFSNKLLFSGCFGSGKTTFIKEFFKNNESKYKAVYLYPVNYSVASNEDIFEYIKYDILSQMLQWEDIGDYLDDIPNSLAAQVLFLNNPGEFILELVKNFSKLSSETKALGSFIKGAEKLKDELDKFKNSNQISLFMEALVNDKGNIFEHNLITFIICSIIKKRKTKHKSQSICLIIDDMDRIDPEHIFRIMNVLAAHNDLESESKKVLAAHNDLKSESKNKFGFDKIITVCDVQNIQSIYHAKYGIHTDFRGYISKFYSRSIFFFDFSQEINNNLDCIFSDIEIDKKNLIRNFQFFYNNILKPVLKELILNKVITIRTIKQTFQDITFNTNRTYRINNQKRLPSEDYLFWLYDVLCTILNDRENLMRILSQMHKDHSIIYADDYLGLLEEIACLLDRKNINEEIDSFISYNYNQELQIKYNGSFDYQRGPDRRPQENFSLCGKIIPLWEMLEKSFLEIKKY